MLPVVTVRTRCIRVWGGGGDVNTAKEDMASNSVSTGERLLALIDDIELISK
jgi:hypothetical protein